MALDTRFPAGMTTFVYNGMRLGAADTPTMRKPCGRGSMP